jgi:hypothetical protein
MERYVCIIAMAWGAAVFLNGAFTCVSPVRWRATLGGSALKTLENSVAVRTAGAAMLVFGGVVIFELGAHCWPTM